MGGDHRRDQGSPEETLTHIMIRYPKNPVVYHVLQLVLRLLRRLKCCYRSSAWSAQLATIPAGMDAEDHERKAAGRGLVTRAKRERRVNWTLALFRYE